MPGSPAFADAHNHIQQFPDPSRVIAQAQAAGVALMISNSASPGDWEPLRRLAAGYPAVIPCFGVHPWFADSFSGAASARLGGYLAASPSCVGEIGLDGSEGKPDMKVQERVFIAQLEVAAGFKKPVVIHCVKAWRRLEEILRSVGAQTPFMLHAYGGSAELVKPLAELGGYFSFSGDIADPARKKLRAALLAAPASRLVFESDSPPPPGRSFSGLRAAPSVLPGVVKAAARILAVPEAGLAARAWDNTREFLSAELADG